MGIYSNIWLGFYTTDTCTNLYATAIYSNILNVDSLSYRTNIYTFESMSKDPFSFCSVTLFIKVGPLSPTNVAQLRDIDGLG